MGQVHLNGLGAGFSQAYVHNPYCFSDVIIEPNLGVRLLSVDGRIQLWIPPSLAAGHIILTHSINCLRVQAAPRQYAAGYNEVNETAAIRAAAETDNNQIVVGHTFYSKRKPAPIKHL